MIEYRKDLGKDLGNKDIAVDKVIMRWRKKSLAEVRPYYIEVWKCSMDFKLHDIFYISDFVPNGEVGVLGLMLLGCRIGVER